jgi:pimeloyl-ACP methyl ester carboxylesterase
MLRRLCILGFGFCMIHAVATAQRHEPVSVKVNGGVLYGTLTIPNSPAKPPVAVIIPATGAFDRDGNAGMMNSNPLKLLGDSLAKRGIASLRFDKRGIGKSAAVTDESRLYFPDYIDDTKALLASLRKQNRFGKVFVIGQGEGALVAFMTAAKTAVEGVISIAGQGQTGDTIMLKQMERQQLRPGPMDTMKMLFSELRRNGAVPQVPAGDLYQTLFRPVFQRYVYSWIMIDPAVEISKLRCPVLLVNSGNDLQIDAAQAGYLHKAAPKSVVLEIPELNQVLRNAPADVGQNFGTAFDPSLPIDSRLVAGIARFIKTGK